MPAMSDDAAQTDAAAGKAKGKRKLLLMLAPLMLGGVGGGLYFAGMIPGVSHGGEAHAASAAPVFFEMPDLVANLNVGNRRPTFIKLRTKLELARPEDVELVHAALPRLQDMFQTYLREMRPEELRNSAGTYRLREELIARASLAAPGAQVRDVLFTELLVQ